MKGPVDNAPAELVPLVFAATAADVASGASLAADPVSAMGMQMNVTHIQALAWDAVITRRVSSVKGEPRTATRRLMGGQATQG